VESKPAGLRDRVQRAIAEHVDASEQLLLELENADSSTKLTTFASGWFRGLAAALEELGAEIEALRSSEDRALRPAEAAGAPVRLDERLEQAEALQERAEAGRPSDSKANDDRPEQSEQTGER
jgi:hypothetical protein